MLVRAPLIASGPLVEAAFVARPNQLIVEARIGTRLVRAHMADRGRLLGLLIPDARLLLAPRDELGRKTAFQVVGVYNGGELISLDTHLPNRLMAAALAARALPQFARYTCMRREVVVGAHLDLLASLAAAGQRCAVVFVIQRQHAAAFTPDEAIDPAFARALRAAISSGVEVYAYCCPLTPEGLTLGPPVPVYGSLEAVPRPLAMP